MTIHHLVRPPGHWAARYRGWPVQNQQRLFDTRNICKNGSILGRSQSYVSNGVNEMLKYIRVCSFTKYEAPSITDFLCWKLLVSFEKAETQCLAQCLHGSVTVSTHCYVGVAEGGPGPTT